LEDKTDLPTEEVKLIDRIKEIITCDFEIVQHFAVFGLLLKTEDHWWEPQNYNSVHILNGLGTRGVMLGPAMAKALYENIEYQVPLNTEIDIKDFKKNYIELFCIWVHEENMY
jgi:hypothetical protein